MSNINRFKHRENIFIILIFIVILEYQTTLVHTFFVDRIVKTVPLLVVILFWRNIRENLENIYIRRILRMYLVLVLLMGVSSVFNLDLLGVEFLFKYYLSLLIVILLLFKVNPRYFSSRIIRFPILIGAALSVISIILWVLVYCGVGPQYSFVLSERISRISQYSYLWGDMRYVSSGLGGFSRACSFFCTPNSFGNFLLFPAIVSFGYFKLKKRIIYLFICILCSVTIVLTFAFTTLLAYIAILSISIFFLTFSDIRVVKKSPFMTGIVALLLALMLMMGVMKYYSSRYSEDPSVTFRGGYYGTIFYAFAVSANDLAPDISKPFGHGLAYHREGKLYTAQYGLVRWILLLGYPGAIFFIVFIAYMFKVHVFPALISKERRIERYVALAFVAQTICEFQEGSWLATTYLFTTAILVLLKKYEFKEWKSF